MGHEAPGAMNSPPTRTRPAAGRKARRTSGSRSPARRFALLLVALSTSPLVGQSVPSVPIDTTGLGSGPAARMHMLLERTIFKVDVLTLEVRFGTATAARIERLLASPGGREGLADSVANAVLAADDALARLEFQRHVRLDQFLDGIRDNLRLATRAGILSPAEFRSISSDLPDWYAFLSERGIRSGDRMHQRVRSDTLRTVYVGAEGDLLLDQVDVGPERRLAVLGGYFAPGSDFREGLVASVLDVRDAD